MTAIERAQQLARDTILKMLSDEENAKVSRAESAAGLPDGEEYVDLEHLVAGVQVAKAPMTTALTGRIVPRSAVRGETWSKIVAQLTH
jgi:hypothetical protein